MKKTEVLDGTARELTPYTLTVEDPELSLDFLEANNLEELENGIKALEKGLALLALYQGLAILKAEDPELGLWRAAGYENLRAYRIDQAARLDMAAATVSNRRTVAEAYLANRKALAKIPLEGNVQKLLFLETALRDHERREVFSHFRTDSYREFVAWAVPAALPSPELPPVDFSIRAGAIFLNGDEVGQLAETLPTEERDFVSATLRAAYRARAGNCLAHVVPVYDTGEARAVDNFLKKLRASK